MRRIVLVVLHAIFFLKQRFISQVLLQVMFVSNRYALLRGLIALLIVVSGTVPSLLIIWKVHLLSKDIYYIALAASIFSIVSLTIFLFVVERVMWVFYDKSDVLDGDGIKVSVQKHRETVRDSE